MGSSCASRVSKSCRADDLLLPDEASCRLSSVFGGKGFVLNCAAIPKLSAQNVTEAPELCETRLSSLFFRVRLGQIMTLQYASELQPNMDRPLTRSIGQGEVVRDPAARLRAVHRCIPQPVPDAGNGPARSVIFQPALAATACDN
ncbi:hypothetical protein CcaCcLH18_10122 [Colletotrichum camelliae]|nr:hypothetical protein CcaCcLH18_10122 [Colletotrichum camelliae]